MSKRIGDPGYAPGWCIHFRSMSDHKTCEAGVSYESFKDSMVPFNKLPCFLTEIGTSKPDSVPCPHLKRPTPEEIEAHKAWIDARMNRMGVVMAGIADWRKANKGKSAREVVECPACKGRLHLSIASYNGHVHGQCETEGCVRWME